MDNEYLNKLKDIENLANNQSKEKLIKLKDEINLALYNIKDKLEFQKIFKNISSIISIILSIAIEINKTNQIYESFLKRDEQTIRILYKNLLTQKLLKESLENKLRLSNKKEKEYELIKEKTGAYIKNGKIIYNKQKENEIIILRQENSNLKDMIKNYEKLIKEKDILYDNLNYEFNKDKTDSSKIIKKKKIYIPNISFNLNNSNNLVNIDNIYTCRINKDKTKKLLKNFNKNNYTNFNYLKYKNFSKINNIPLNNCLTSRNNMQISADNINQKDIYLKRLHNSKNKEKKELYINSDSQNDISTLLKKPLQGKEALNLKKQKFNLLEAYNTGSSNNMNKFNVSKRLSNYFKKEISASFYSKNNKSLLNNNSKKNKSNSNNRGINKNSFETETIQKSYISNIPFNKYKKSKKISKEINKTKKEDENEKNRNEYCCGKNYYKKYSNIDTKKIFLQNSIIKKGKFL